MERRKEFQTLLYMLLFILCLAFHIEQVSYIVNVNKPTPHFSPLAMLMWFEK
jgi:hypothetical protein